MDLRVSVTRMIASIGKGGVGSVERWYVTAELALFTSPRQPQSRLLSMIRRNPTLIQMSDLDVQDIRDMVAQQREDALRQQEALAEVRRAAENLPTEKTPADLLEKYKVAEAKQHERNRRLGLETGEFFCR